MRFGGFPCDNLSAMNALEELDQIPRGNTAPGVNRAIIEYLLKSGNTFAGAAVLDVPCGNADLLDALKKFFPDSLTFGTDINPPEKPDHQISKADASADDRLGLDRRFKLITCVSGVMEFDNTLNFFRSLRKCIADDGVLIVTNDNLLSVRDRLLYFFSGRLRQYPMFVDDNAPTWKILPLQNLLRILGDAEFEVREIRYVPAKWSEWLLLPAALPIYLFQSIAFALDKHTLSYKEKATRYPFASLFSRHYFIVCGPREL